MCRGIRHKSEEQIFAVCPRVTGPSLSPWIICLQAPMLTSLFLDCKRDGVEEAGPQRARGTKSTSMASCMSPGLALTLFMSGPKPWPILILVQLCPAGKDPTHPGLSPETTCSVKQLSDCSRVFFWSPCRRGVLSMRGGSVCVKGPL